MRVVNLHERSLKYVKIQNVETLEEVILVPQATLGGDSYRFTGIVAAGHYKTKEIHGSDVDDFGVVRIHHSLKLPMDQDAANRFDVASGQLTNLGSVVVTPVQGERFVAPREGTPVAALEWLQYANPGLAAKLDPKRELGWLEPVSGAVKELNRQQISYAQTKAVATTVPLVDSCWRRRLHRCLKPGSQELEADHRPRIQSFCRLACDTSS